MASETMWRGLAVGSTLGWGLTVLAWLWSTPAAVQPPAPPTPAVAQSSAPRSLPPQARRVLPPQVTPAETPADETALREAIRGEVLEELEQERAQRRHERSEAHLSHLLDEVAVFAEDHDLDADAQAGLETAMLEMHERMEALRGRGPRGPGGPDEETLAAIEASFAQLEDDSLATLGDPDLAEAFAEHMRPPPLRRR